MLCDPNYLYDYSKKGETVGTMKYQWLPGTKLRGEMNRQSTEDF